MKFFLIIVALSFLGPIIGSLIGVLKKPSDRFMYHMLSFAGGVMLAISFLELIPESIHQSSTLMCVIGIVTGSAFIYLLDRLIPHIHPELSLPEERCSKLKKTAILLLFGIFLHNFPEGMAMGIGSVSGLKLSLMIAIAIAIHDIPEGICTSAPYYYCTKKRLKSFLISSSTAIPTLIGFVITYYLYKSIPLFLIGVIIGFTAGIMIFISAHELIPSSCYKVTNRSTIFSFIIGVLFVIALGAI